MKTRELAPPTATPKDPDQAEQAHPGFGVPSQDPRPGAQSLLQPEEAEREASSALAGGGALAGAAAGALVGVAVAGPVGVVVGGTVGAFAGAVGGAAASAQMSLAGAGDEGTLPAPRSGPVTDPVTDPVPGVHPVAVPVAGPAAVPAGHGRPRD